MLQHAHHHRQSLALQLSWPTNPLCDIPSGCCFSTGPWTVTCSSLCVLRQGAVFPGGVVFAVAEPRSWRTGGVLVGAGVVFRFLLPTPLRTQVVHPMPRRVSTCVRPYTSTPPSGVLVVHHVPPRHVGLGVGRKSPTTLWVARLHGALLDGSGWRALHGWRVLLCGCRGWFMPHGGRVVVLGSARPGFVKGSLPFPHHPGGPNCAAGVAPTMEWAGFDSPDLLHHRGPVQRAPSSRKTTNKAAKAEEQTQHLTGPLEQGWRRLVMRKKNRKPTHTHTRKARAAHPLH